MKQIFLLKLKNLNISFYFKFILFQRKQMNDTLGGPNVTLQNKTIHFQHAWSFYHTVSNPESISEHELAVCCMHSPKRPASAIFTLPLFWVCLIQLLTILPLNSRSKLWSRDPASKHQIKIWPPLLKLCSKLGRLLLRLYLSAGSSNCHLQLKQKHENGTGS